jgi:DNA-binding GntR family transcriptional regulator
MSDRESARYPQIAEHYRDLISSGRMGPGERLPAIAALAAEWDVSPATANKAVKALVDEQLVVSSPAGSFVAPPVYTLTPHTRAIQALRARQPLRYQEQVEITEAGLTAEVPGYVRVLLGVPEGPVGRREAVYTYRGTVETLIVSWHPPALVEACPELARPEPIGYGTLGLVAERTGRRPAGGDDYARARSADEREARLLRVDLGAPVLAIVGDRRDGEGVIEYVECVYPQHKITHYRWTLAES